MESEALTGLLTRPASAVMAMAMLCVYQAESAWWTGNASINRSSSLLEAGPVPDSYPLITPGDFMGDANV